MKCRKCGSTKAIGTVVTSSPTGSFGKRFELCMPHIIDIEWWIEGTHMLPSVQKTLEVKP